MPLLAESLSEASKGLFESFAYENDFLAELRMLWAPPQEEEAHFAASRPLESLDAEISFSLVIPERTPWAIAFTPSFRKSVSSVDKKLQGRVLAALSELSESPVTSHGDTVKPLMGDLKGLWRYRVGDYRLVYQPQSDNKTVVLLEFAARGGVYE